MDEETVAARAAELGADIRCVDHMSPSDRTDSGDGNIGQCAVLVQRDGDTLSLMRHDFRCEGMSPKRAKAGSTKTGIARLDAFLGTIARLQARERAVAAHPTEGLVYPPWSFSVDALAMEIAATAGVDLVRSARPSKQDRVFTQQFGRLATPAEAWQWSREMHAVKGCDPQQEIAGLRALLVPEMKGDRLVARVLGFPERNMTLREEPAGTWLLLWDNQLPDTVLDGLKGRRLSQVVEGLGDGHEIVRAENREGTAWLRIVGPRVPLAAAPEGADTSWMEL